MSRLEIESDEDWYYFKHGKQIYRVSYYEMADAEDWERVVQ